jgi:RNA polymerase sigma factor (sigma-70 family)
VLLAEARRARVQPALRLEAVEDCLADLAIALSKPTAKTPRSLSSYVAVAFRHQLERMGRRAVRSDATSRSAVDEEAGPRGEGVVRQLASDASLRAASPGGDGDEERLSRALEGLTDALDRVLSDEERQLLAWLGERVPQREIAAWLGIAHGTARQRTFRLRARLHRVATDYMATVRDEAHRLELTRFLRRASGVGGTMPPSAGGNRSAGGVVQRCESAVLRSETEPSDDGRT